MRLFRRRARLHVGRLVIDSRDGPDFKFSVERSTEREPNTAKVEVWNLSEDQRGQIERRGEVVAKLEVGYEEAEVFELFRGNVRYGRTRRDGVDLITTVESGDGESSVRSSRVSASFRRGAKTEDVVRRLADAMKVDAGNVLEQLAGQLMGGNTDAFEHGTVVDGAVADELDRILKSNGLEWSIQGGRLQVTKKGQGLKSKPVLLTSRFEGRPEVNEQGQLVFVGAGENTGLLGSPSVDSEGVIEARALLAPGLTPGRRVKIQTETIDAIGVVREAAYEGSTFGQSWDVTMQLEPESA